MLIQAGKHYINPQEILIIQCELAYIIDGISPTIYKFIMKDGVYLKISEEDFKDFKKNYTERYRVDVF
jgi:hypothetical protein